MTNTHALRYEWFARDGEAIFRIVGTDEQKSIRIRGITKETMTDFYRLLCDNKVYPEHLTAAAEDYLAGLMCLE